MDHFQVEIGEITKPMGLPMIEGLRGAEVGQILVISTNLYGKRGSMEVVPPGFQGANDV